MTSRDWNALAPWDVFWHVQGETFVAGMTEASAEGYYWSDERGVPHGPCRTAAEATEAMIESTSYLRGLVVRLADALYGLRGHQCFEHASCCCAAWCTACQEQSRAEGMADALLAEVRKLP